MFARPAKKEYVVAQRTAAKGKSTKKAAAESAVDVENLVVRADEDPWTDDELAEVRDELQGDAARLRAEIAEAEADIADLLQGAGEEGGEDAADTGAKAFEREHEMALAASHREILGQVERALRSIETSSYGVCESCGKPIGKARLQAFPRATLCLACKQRQERH
jgi:DnaK suppressor protein